jgi:hypothetical protein
MKHVWILSCKYGIAGIFKTRKAADEYARSSEPDMKFNRKYQTYYQDYNYGVYWLTKEQVQE